MIRTGQHFLLSLVALKLAQMTPSVGSSPKFPFAGLRTEPGIIQRIMPALFLEFALWGSCFDSQKETAQVAGP